MIKLLSMLWLVGFLAVQSGFCAASAPHRHHAARTAASGKPHHKRASAHHKPRVKHPRKKHAKRHAKNTGPSQAGSPLVPNNPR